MDERKNTPRPPTIPSPKTLRFPIDEYGVNGLGFLEEATYGGVYWGFHLAEDIIRPAGTPILSIGRGRVVYSALHPGSAAKGNWGNLMVIAHTHPKTKQPFYAVYAHMQERPFQTNDLVKKGQVIGAIGKKNTPENGWWNLEHLHFGIYIGEWHGQVLPGYWTPSSTRTKKEDWVKPTEYIAQYPHNTL